MNSVDVSQHFSIGTFRIRTQVTLFVPDLLMHSLDVFGQIGFVGRLEVAQLTLLVFDFVVDGFDVFLQGDVF